VKNWNRYNFKAIYPIITKFGNLIHNYTLTNSGSVFSLYILTGRRCRYHKYQDNTVPQAWLKILEDIRCVDVGPHYHHSCCLILLPVKFNMAASAILNFRYIHSCSHGTAKVCVALFISHTKTPPVEAQRPVVTYLEFPIQVCFSILIVYRSRPARHAHFRHRHPCGLNSSVDVSLKRRSCVFLTNANI